MGRRGAESTWSEAAFFEMGLLKRDEWKADWIGAPIVGGPYTSPIVPHLRKPFMLTKSVKSARLYVTALGLHEFHLNGKPVSDARFAPGRTEYRKRVPYHVYDVTSLLAKGENVAGAMLGDGWYCGHLHSDPRQTYGDRPRLLAQLEVTFDDGSTQVITSDSTWRAGEGPIRQSDMLMGEDYDARLEINGWSAAGFNDSSWRPVVTFADPGIELSAAIAPPTVRTQEIKPITPPKASANKRRHIYDLGQNMVGHIRLRVRDSKPGQTIDLRYTEMLDKDGKPYTTALRSARATDHYTTRGSAEETYEPRFTFHGFRYIEVRDYPGRNPQQDDLVGVVVHSDCPTTGTFECSDPMLNQLQRNITWSQRGNFLDIPTDCPQRDERLGWTGDAQVFIRTAAFNMDVSRFFAKWVLDVQDAQFEDGHVPSVVPHVTSIHHEGGPAWADAAVICPWVLYLCYGDARVLSDRYGMMQKFVAWLERECGPTFIRCDERWKWKGYGDWLSINADTPADLIGTAFYAYVADLMSRIATVLGRKEDATKYAKLFENVCNAFCKRFVTPDGLIAAQTQTAYVLALHFNLLPVNLREKVANALVANIKARGMHLSTGFVGTPYLNHVLTNAGRHDVAYALLLQKTFPSWLYPITQGATTMWERWDGWTHEKGFHDAGMNSYNHYAFGAVGEWMYSVVAGIDLDPSMPGYKHIRFNPTPGGGLTWARASLESLYGKIECGWKLNGETLSVEVLVPPNTTATLGLPTTDAASITEAQGTVKVQRVDNGRAVVELEAGRYSFKTKYAPAAMA
ncbi:MAG: glycoside hydrolase family 78 protein [Tepidisphaeraceae bacterium]